MRVQSLLLVLLLIAGCGERKGAEWLSTKDGATLSGMVLRTDWLAATAASTIIVETNERPFKCTLKLWMDGHRRTCTKTAGSWGDSLREAINRARAKT